MGGSSDFAFVNQQDICLSELYVPAEGAFEGVCVFVSCRTLTGAFTVVAMVAIVDVMGWNEWIGKVAVSAMSLVLELYIQ